MEFEFITDASGLTELDVLIKIYNLGLMMCIFCLCIVGFNITYMCIKKVVNMNK